MVLFRRIEAFGPPASFFLCPASLSPDFFAARALRFFLDRAGGSLHRCRRLFVWQQVARLLNLRHQVPSSAVYRSSAGVFVDWMDSFFLLSMSYVVHDVNDVSRARGEDLMTRMSAFRLSLNNWLTMII